MIPLRLVLDTNIFVSAALKPDSLPRSVVVLALAKPARLYVTREILAEYRDVLLRRELAIPRGRRHQFLEFIGKRAYLVKPSRIPEITSDPEDRKFLECADAARADYLVTGNTGHFPAFWKRTKIITVREFLILVSPHLLG
jgi:putative PIN family toxin of toxin-antitoxin system